MDEAEAKQRYINEPVAPYNLSNPHPLYGKDPNIINEFGHTHYPKWITVGEQQVIAKDAKHEKELLGIKEEKKVHSHHVSMSKGPAGDHGQVGWLGGGKD